VLPEERHAERAKGAIESRLERSRDVEVGLDDLGTELRELQRLIGFDVAGERLLVSLNMDRTSPPPWLPVAPTTAMIFFSAMQCSLQPQGARDVRIRTGMSAENPAVTDMMSCFVATRTLGSSSAASGPGEGGQVLR
jgi:hypothetical protein